MCQQILFSEVFIYFDTRVPSEPATHVDLALSAGNILTRQGIGSTAPWDDARVAASN